MRIKDLPEIERPREKLELFGPNKISDEELLAILIKTGSKNNSCEEIARDVLNKIKSLNNLESISLKTFSDIKGLGKVKTIELLAALELGRRVFLIKNDENIKYLKPEVIYEYNKYLFVNKKQEYFYCLYLDNQNKLIERKLLFMGTINRSVVHPREIFKEAYLNSASGIVCLHNHPSGDLHPSKEDIELTKNLIKIGRIQGISIVDHLIISNQGYYSFFDNTDLFQ